MASTLFDNLMTSGGWVETPSEIYETTNMKFLPVVKLKVEAWNEKKILEL